MEAGSRQERANPPGPSGVPGSLCAKAGQPRQGDPAVEALRFPIKRTCVPTPSSVSTGRERGCQKDRDPRLIGCPHAQASGLQISTGNSASPFSPLAITLLPLQQGQWQGMPHRPAFSRANGDGPSTWMASCSTRLLCPSCLFEACPISSSLLLLFTELLFGISHQQVAKMLPSPAASARHCPMCLHCFVANSLTAAHAHCPLPIFSLSL